MIYMEQRKKIWLTEKNYTPSLPNQKKVKSFSLKIQGRYKVEIIFSYTTIRNGYRATTRICKVIKQWRDVHYPQYLAKNIQSTLTSTFSQQLDPKLLHPTLHVLLRIRLRDCFHNLAGTDSWVLPRRETDRPPIIIKSRPGRRLRRSAPRTVRFCLAPFISINTIAINIIATRIVTLSIQIRPQIGSTPIITTISIVEKGTVLIVFHEILVRIIVHRRNRSGWLSKRGGIRGWKRGIGNWIRARVWVWGNWSRRRRITGSRLMLIVGRIVGLLLRRLLVGRVRLEVRERRGLWCGIEGLQVRIRSLGDVWRSSGRGRDRIGILGIRSVIRWINRVIGGSVTVGKRRSRSVRSLVMICAAAGARIRRRTRVSVLEMRRIGIVWSGAVIPLLHRWSQQVQIRREWVMANWLCLFL